MNCSICGLPKENVVGSVLPQCMCGWQAPKPPVTEGPKLFGFGDTNPEPINYPMVFTGHYLVGGNPDDPEHGYWDTEQEAIINFALQFAKLAENAQGNFLFVRKAPIASEDAVFGHTVKWRMIGRFSIGKLKEKNT